MRARGQRACGASGEKSLPSDARGRHEMVREECAKLPVGSPTHSRRPWGFVNDPTLPTSGHPVNAPGQPRRKEGKGSSARTGRDTHAENPAGQIRVRETANASV